MGRRDADKPVFPIWASGRHDSCGRYAREAFYFQGLWAARRRLVNPDCGTRRRRCLGWTASRGSTKIVSSATPEIGRTTLEAPFQCQPDLLPAEKYDAWKAVDSGLHDWRQT
jgi:hypothetical protein